MEDCAGASLAAATKNRASADTERRMLGDPDSGIALMLERSTGQRNDTGGTSGNMRFGAGLTILIAVACTGARESPADVDSSAPVAGRTADSVSRGDSTLWLLAPNGNSADLDRGATRAALVLRFGASNVIDTTIYLGEGETRAGTVLFPMD